MQFGLVEGGPISREKRPPTSTIPMKMGSRTTLDIVQYLLCLSETVSTRTI